MNSSSELSVSMRSLLFVSCLFVQMFYPLPIHAADECPCNAPIVSFPNFEDFSSQSTCALDGLKCAQACPISGTWQNVSTDDIDWIIRSVGTPSDDTGPARDATTGSGNYAYLESSCPDIGHPDKDAVLFSKCFNFTNIQAPELNFAYHMFGEEMGDLRVEISTDSCLSWTPIDTISGPQQSSSSEEWRHRIVNMIEYSGLSNVRLRFRGTSGSDQTSDMAIDDLVIREANCCDLAVKEINSIKSSCQLGNSETITAKIENLGYNMQSDFEISYQIDDGLIVTENFDGMLPGGSYINYSFATPADFSTPGDHIVRVFTGLANDARNENDLLEKIIVHVPTISVFPYTQNFESGHGGWLPEGSLSTWALGEPLKTFIQGAASGDNAWTTGGLGSGRYRNNEASMVLSPCFDFSALKFPVISMKVWWNAEGDWDGAVLQSSIDGGLTWQRVGNVSDTVYWYNNSAIAGSPGGETIGWSGSKTDGTDRSSGGWVSARNLLSGLAEKSSVALRIAFGSDPKIKNDGFAFDDIEINEGLTVTKTNALFTDINGNGRADPGDVIQYTVTIAGMSPKNITGVIFEDTPPAETSLVVGSVTTSQGTVSRGNGAGHTFVRVYVGTLGGSSTASIGFKATVNAPLPGSGLQICNQGTLLGNGFTSFPSDDPSQSGEANSTCIAAYADSDGDGVPDGLDKCPGYPDSQDGDGDGTPDGCDGCPADPLKTDPGACGCGVPEVDYDGDGTPDCVDGCPNDPQKTEPGVCGCGVADTDSDGDGAANCIDGCVNDPNKTAPGACGCGVADTDSDSDGTPNCNDACPDDPQKVQTGICGCGVADTDSDSDGVANCIDGCPDDSNKTQPGVCGCGVADTDTDGDGTANCIDLCPNDPQKVNPGQCGCGIADTDSDTDGIPDCNDECPYGPNDDSDGDGTPDCLDGCINDPAKTQPGVCGCGVADTDSDSDGVANCIDNCPNDPDKTQPGACGCGVADTDSDGDETPNCNDNCPNDPAKTQPGVCGCGVADTDTDSDGAANCIDNCPNDPGKTQPGVCGCGVADTDSDSDGAANCIDNCPNDPGKTQPGVCGCGVADTDSDSDGTANCNDNCPNDPAKTEPGVCGCGVADTDSDSDGAANCIDNCPNDPGKTEPGVCGCGVADIDSDNDGTMNCIDECPADPEKILSGMCGCGEAETDSDSDGTPDCVDLCPQDPDKTEPKICGCNVADVDTDGDTMLDCWDRCPNDPEKTTPGICGCNVSDQDSDGDKVADCDDGCPSDSGKTAPGVCGCGVKDTDSDGDGTADCVDLCSSDPLKIEPGVCGCGVVETGDSDTDGTADCKEQCPLDPAKTGPGICGCGVPDLDLNSNNITDCLFQAEFSLQLKDVRSALNKLKSIKGKKARATKKVLKSKLSAIRKYTGLYASQILLVNSASPAAKIKDLQKSVNKVIKAKNAKMLKKNKTKTRRFILKLIKAVL